MSYKTLTQVLLFIILLIILFYYYNKIYEFQNFNDQEELKLNSENLNESTELKNVTYETKALDGTQYLINSKSGEFLSEKKNTVFLKDVTILIKLTNSDEIILVSKEGFYDTENNSIKLVDEVRLNYLDHVVESKKFDIFFNKNLIEAYDNLRYKGPNYKLIADKSIIDLVNRDIKIFMFDNSKVKILKAG